MDEVLRSGDLSPAFRPLQFAELPGWNDDDQLPAWQAFRRSAIHVKHKPYRSGGLGVSADSFRQAFSASLEAEIADTAAARAFFERFFVPCLVDPSPAQAGLVTGFYEPEADASDRPDERFRHPVYARPHDLVEVDEVDPPQGLEAGFRFGRKTADGVTEYFDRPSIEQGALAGRGLEIAWLADPVDLFFIHVQGAARLRMRDGQIMRITYAAKSGHPFTGIGGVLVGLGELPRDKVTMQTIRAWLAAHPDRVNDILWRNRSFIFFKEAPVEDPELGPIAAAKVQLTPGRSMAVDRLLHTFATPFFVDAPALTAFEGKPFRRLMIAQDTGTAIVGAARGDLFAGSGEAAGEIAGVVNNRADFYALVPRQLVGESRR